MTVLVGAAGLEVRYRTASLVERLRGNQAGFAALDGIDLEVRRGETIGIVGESGSGKSTLARALLRFIAPTRGKVIFEGRDLATLDAGALRKFRCQAQMIFQDPVVALNPRMTVRQCLDEVLYAHGMGERSKRAARIEELLDMVGLPPDLAGRRPSALSGGQCQRVGIARALAVSPQLLIADEATAALDVSIQAQILNLLADLKAQFALTVILISHNLGIVRHVCDRVVVMKDGRIVEQGQTEHVLAQPREAYTRTLISAVPSMARIHAKMQQRAV